LPNDGLSTLRNIVDEYSEVPKAKSSCCFKKTKEKKSLSIKYDLSDESLEMKNNLSNFKKFKISYFKNEENFRKAFNLDEFKIKLEQELVKKLASIIDKKEIVDKLNDEVDKYSPLFNVNKIISKQERKIKRQNKKLNAIDDSKTLDECIICMENERSVIFYPCLHFVCCSSCGISKIQIECPSCLSKIENKQVINF
jgi:hypothetical protein